MKKKMFMLFLLFVVVFTMAGCGKKKENLSVNVAADEAADAVYVCKTTVGAEEKEYTIITTGNGKVQSVLYSAYVKATNNDEYNKFCSSYKESVDKYDEKYVYGDANCDDKTLSVSVKQEWLVEADVNKKYPDYVKKHVNSVGDIDIKGMKEDFSKENYECNRR